MANGDKLGRRPAVDRRIVVLQANMDRRIVVLPANMDRRIVVLPANMDRRIVVLPANMDRRRAKNHNSSTARLEKI